MERTNIKNLFVCVTAIVLVTLTFASCNSKTVSEAESVSSRFQLSGNTAYYLDNDKGTDLFKTDVNDISKAVSVNPASDDILNIIASDKALYYATLTEIYKADIDGKNETKICDDFNGVDHFILINDTIYYANNAGKIKSVSVSGENSKILYEDTRYADVDKNIRIVDLVDDYIYFYVDGGLGKVNTDGSNATIFYETNY